MDDQDKLNRQVTLENAIQKAVDGGWDWQESEHHSIKTFAWFISEPWYTKGDYQWIIFNHDFAKALWGDRDQDRMVIVGETDWRKWPLPWQYHLQQMVIADDPIKYLGDNLDG